MKFWELQVTNNHMPFYSYTAKDNSGKTKKDIAQAVSEEALIEKLQGEGYFILGVELSVGKTTVRKAEGSVQEFKFSHDKMKIEDLLVFSRQLSTMLQAGVTLLRSLNVILTQIQSKQLYNGVKQIYNDIEQGSSLSAAFAKHPKIFDQFWVSLAEVGEASGTMPLVLNKLADHVEQDVAFRSAIVSAMVYPMILCGVCVGAVVFFALVVAPKFEDVFNSMHAQLPLMTRLLLTSFHFIKNDILLIIGAGTGVFFFLKSYFSTSIGELHYEKIIFGLPIVGEMSKLIIVERFAAQMAILTESGVPILYALEISQKLVDNKTCGMVISQVREGVREGVGMADAMMDSGFFPIMAVQMIKVGEETGELGKMLKHVADFYKANVEAFMKRFGTLLEPFMLVFMAFVIGVIVISIFLPLFQLGQGAHSN